ncbi:hypothetical protein [Roseococcus sp. YIM B11640]|uniref:hypothetical protein n=1 Tax=Roseococcus sp. YIM B11640 TaxID=3133973 RepID=UPI003C7E4D42
MHRLIALLLLLLPGLAAAQGAVTCERIEGTERSNIIPATRHEAVIEGGSVRRIMLTLTNGRQTTTELTPMQGGVSVRLTTFADPRDAAQVTAVFNRAVLGADGVVLLETWLRRTGETEPSYNFYRMRCGASGGTAKQRL